MLFEEALASYAIAYGGYMQVLYLRSKPLRHIKGMYSISSSSPVKPCSISFVEQFTLQQSRVIYIFGCCIVGDTIASFILVL